MRRSFVGWVSCAVGAASGPEDRCGGEYGSGGVTADGPALGDWEEYDGGMPGSRDEAGEPGLAAERAPLLPAAGGGTSISSMSVMPSESMSLSRVWTKAKRRLSGDQAGRSSLSSGALVSG